MQSQTKTYVSARLTSDVTRPAVDGEICDVLARRHSLLTEAATWQGGSGMMTAG